MKKTALIIVDLQNDYFKNGKWELKGTENAAKNASKLLNMFREKGLNIVHIRHEFPTNDAPFFIPNSKGSQIHPSVKALDNEPIVLKHQINSFRDTNLKTILDSFDVENVIICGAMSHMCIDSATRASNDFGYNCTVVHDACATLDLEFQGEIIPAKQVHASFMAALGFAYADIVSTQSLLTL